MNYINHYDLLIERSKNRIIEEYTESHHIIPRCMGGTDKDDNLVDLTPEEHYVAHQLLVKIYPDNYSLVKAAQMMIPNRPSNKMYGWLRRKFAKAQSIGQTGINNSNYGMKWISNPISSESLKVKDIEPFLKNGWILGKHKIDCKKCSKIISLIDIKSHKCNIKKCGVCGQSECKEKNICSKSQMINTLIKFFNFDKNKKGTQEVYNEYHRVRKLIHDEYHVNKLSTINIVKKYNVTSTQRLDSIFKSLDIPKRSLSEALKNYCNGGLVSTVA